MSVRRTHFSALSFAFTALLGAGLLTHYPATARADDQSSDRTVHAQSFDIKGGNFLVDGKPIQLISGEIHYPRIAPEYWRQRLKMAKACGLNAITTYVFWNMHEPEKGKWDFKGANDVARFVKIAQEEGLYVILRPGPYVCAEWDFGGYPYWLLNEKGMTIRTHDAKYMQFVQRYFDQLAKQLIPLQADRGGNLIMVQVENEYGSYGNDRVYIGMVRDALKKAGFTVPLFMCDGGPQLANDYVQGLFPGENGGSGPEVKRTIDKYYPGGPYFVPEYYPGWLDHWGAPMVRVSTQSVVRSTERMLDGGISFNYYMFHGGTNFAFTNGANFGGTFEPDITSYDYDAPLDEAGHATPKFMAIREAIKKRVGEVAPVPPAPPVISIPTVNLTTHGSLLGTLPAPIKSAGLKSMEEIGQDYGFILYRTKLTGPVSGKLVIKDVRDYAVVMLNGKRLGVIDRRHKAAPIEINQASGEATLDILVENGGRINYGPLLLDNRKGVTEYVRLGETQLTGWEIYSLPFKHVSSLKYDGASTDGPAVRKGEFSLKSTGDTYLDMRGWRKGVVFINGHNLGRFWEIGPQQTLYVPGVWLKKGKNEVVVLDLIPSGKTSVEGLDHAILDDVHAEEVAVKHRAVPAVVPAPRQEEKIAGGEFGEQDGPQDVKFEAKRARYVAFQAISSHDGDYASCAEFYLLDVAGKPVNRDTWKIFYSDSEETAQEDGSADNMIDDDNGTIWHSVWSTNHGPLPHFVVIDLGKETEFAGSRYVARPGKKPAKTKQFAIYASDSPFNGAK